MVYNKLTEQQIEKIISEVINTSRRPNIEVMGGPGFHEMLEDIMKVEAANYFKEQEDKHEKELEEVRRIINE